LLPSVVITLLYLFINHGFLIVNYLFSASGAFLFFLLLFLFTKGKGMGFGDVKFAFLMGLILGFPKIIVSLYVAFLTGAIVGCILIIWRKKRMSGSSIPFGPFLVVGTLIAIFYGEILFKGFLRLASL
jgi:prepilin signal peptidase PulO-like enzyme (type II secretory pathway)